MRQGGIRAAWTALGIACVLASAAHNAIAAPPKSAPAKSASASSTRVAMHQFSGIVTAIDKSSLTVEKQGRSPRTMQFVRDAKMTTQGEVLVDARVEEIPGAAEQDAAKSFDHGP